MTYCASCGRALKRKPIMVNGNPMGPVCATKAPAVAPADGDLFGCDTEVAAQHARSVVLFVIWNATRTAKRETARDFAEARGRLGL